MAYNDFQPTPESLQPSKAPPSVPFFPKRISILATTFALERERKTKTKMFDFGDEVTIESYRIPWLIWIQILVLLLLIMLLYGFTLFVLDLPETPSSSSVSQLGIIPVFSPTTELASQVVEKQSIMGEIGISRGTCRRIVSGGGEESVEMERCSKNEDRHGLHHPCHYFRLAKLAFLKCLGLDFLCSDNASIAEQR